MTNTKSTKRALLVSVMAMVICFTMLLGTTFAWFTDSEVSNNNIIKSGNLDVTFEYSLDNGANWENVATSTEIFDENALWEPGYTDVVYLRVRNVGTLALNYQVGITKNDETSGTNVNGASFNLSDYIKYSVINLGTSYTPYSNAAAAIDVAEATGAETLSQLPYASETGSITAETSGEVYHYFAIVVYMPTSVDNVANYKVGTTAPQVELGVKLVATQMASESDHYNNQYDAGRPNP